MMSGGATIICLGLNIDIVLYLLIFRIMKLLLHFLCLPVLVTPSAGTRSDGGITPEPVFLNIYGAQESIPRNEFYVAWRAGTITLFLLGAYPPQIL